MVTFLPTIFASTVSGDAQSVMLIMPISPLWGKYICMNILSINIVSGTMHDGAEVNIAHRTTEPATMLRSMTICTSAALHAKNSLFI